MAWRAVTQRQAHTQGLSLEHDMSHMEIPIYAPDIMKLLGIRHPNTLRLKIKNGQIPAPDVRITQKTRYWHRATLVKAGLLPPESQPTQVTGIRIG